MPVFTDELVGGEVDVSPQPRNLVLESSTSLAAANPDSFSGAYENEDGAVVLAVVEESVGSVSLEEIADSAAAARQPLPELRTVKYSSTALEAIELEILTSGDLPTSVSYTYVYEALNVVVVRVPQITVDMRAVLWDRYGDAVMIAVGPAVTSQSVRGDTSPYYGGSQFAIRYSSSPTSAIRGRCTSGWPWIPPNGRQVIVTAGHCLPNGQYRSTWQDTSRNGTYPSRQGSAGTSTYIDNVGTRFYNGDYYSDIAFMNIVAGKATLGRVHTSEGSADRALGGAHVSPGDGFCTFGAATGSNCSWRVTETNGSYIDNENGGALVRNVIVAFAVSGNCPRNGDSGGPSYQRGSSGIYAVGVASGSGFNVTRGSISNPCLTFQSSIHHVTEAFGGGLKRG